MTATADSGTALMPPRRQVLIGAGAGLASFLLPYGAPAASAARPKPPFRVVYSNDLTNIVSNKSPFNPSGKSFAPGMVEASVVEAGAADVQFLQPGFGWTAWWQSAVDPPAAHWRWFHEKTGIAAPWWLSFLVGGGDFVDLFVKACRKIGRPAMISLRMNDGHHLAATSGPNMAETSRFYDDHPEWRIAVGPHRDFRANWWSRPAGNLNWAVPEVRAQKFQLLQELATKYDIDGLELDFMRHPLLFRVTETDFATRSGIIRDFVASVRRVLDRTSPAGRRRWLSVRIPAFTADYDELGFDPPAMYAAGVDMFNLSCSLFTEQQTDLPAICRLVPGAAVLLEMTDTPMIGPHLHPGPGDAFPYLRTTDEMFYTGANLAYRRGAAGVSLFNFAYYREYGAPEGRGPFTEPPFHVLGRLGDRDFLARQPQWYELAQSYSSDMVKGPLPLTLDAGQPVRLSLDLAPPARPIAAALLRLRFRDRLAGTVTAAVNARPLAAAAFVAKPLPSDYDAWLGAEDEFACFSVPAGTLGDGANEIEIELADGAPAALIYLDLTLR
jgi:hypothetical protein